MFLKRPPSGESSERQRVAGGRRPVLELETVRREQRQGQAVDAEGDAARMRNIAILDPQIPGLAEMIAVIVEAHAGGRLLLGAHRNEQLEFEGLLDLVH